MKVFGIGLNKTGTKSLHRAFQILGLRSLHGIRRATMTTTIARRLPLLTHIGGYDAYCDIQALSVRFDQLDQEYPGSRFILTTRDVDDWIDSRRRHVERNRKRNRNAKGKYQGTFLEIDEDAWRAMFFEHETRVRDYFAERDDFLAMNIPGGQGWELLCPFLGKEAPTEPFPSISRGVAGGISSSGPQPPLRTS